MSGAAGWACSAVDEQRLHRAEQPRGSARHARQLHQAVRQWFPALPALALLGRDRTPQRVDDAARLAGDLADVAVEMRGPQSKACVARERRVAGDDIDLAVVEERMSIEIRRP